MARRPWSVALVVGLGASLAGCGGSGDDDDDDGFVGLPPTLALTQPAANVTVEVGAVVTVQYADADADGVAMTVLFADRDGNASTTADSFDLTRARPDQDGATQSVAWETAGLSPGTYTVFGTTWDGFHAPVTVAAAGTVTVRANAWSGGAGGAEFTAGAAVFADGSSVVVGTFDALALFGEGEPNETALSSAGVSDVFVVRYEADGTLAWAKSAGGPDFDGVVDVAAFPDGSCVVTGVFRGSATFGAGEPGQTVLTGANDDVYVARFAANGTLAWAKSAGGANFDYAAEVAAFADGTCVVAGVFDTSATFGLSEPGQTVLTSAGSVDMFVARFGVTGSLVWARSAGGANGEQVGGVATFADGSCVVVGTFPNSAIFGPGDPNQTILVGAAIEVFVARFNASGTLAWAKGTTGTAAASGLEVATFADGTCVASGTFSGSVTFGPGEPGQTVLVATGMFLSQQMFVARFDVAGLLAWVTSVEPGGSFGGPFPYDLATLADGSCVLAGTVSGTAVFGAGEVNETTLFGLGSSEAFLARFAAVGTLDWAVGFGGASSHAAIAVEVLAGGDLLVAGYFEFSVTFGYGTPSETTLGTPVTYFDVFVALFGADGAF